MTIKKSWMYILILSTVISIFVNTFVLSVLINRYFINYTEKNYTEHFDQIVEYTKQALMEENISKKQIAIQLQAHLQDPIIRIKLFDEKDSLIVDVNNFDYEMNGMMKNGFMNQMMGAPSEEVDNIKIYSEDVFLGTLFIIRYSSIGNSIAARMFRVSLISSIFISFIISIIFIIAIGLFASKKMSKELMETASLALNIDLKDNNKFKFSKFTEIRIIQQSLETFQTKLKIKQKSRKKLVDELIHQTRTPLTILKTHLEGYEDGIITMSSEEIKICETQIENLTLIISNMSQMIDAEKETDSLKIEDVNIHNLLKQIVGGLKLQFDKKKIHLSLTGNQKIIIKTDKYKLSQSIYNILTNAYKFTNQNGEVNISHETDKDILIIKFADNGIGISHEDTTHLFDAYYKGNNSENSSGDGIGLFVANENIKSIKGKIEVESDVGKGSIFIIKIPRELEADT